MIKQGRPEGLDHMSVYVFDPIAIPYLLAFLVSAGLGGLLLYMKGREPLVQLFVVYQMAIAGMALCAAMATMSRDVAVWNVWNNLTI
ncbi:MAG: hypothetical protein GWN12_03800, partial [Thermoplasmata archaeon]|nr:hypothetical protein [Thermoplasmata archaeon]NIS11166.1 hypothetical protein [Thermoplasmata archaeon]NIW87915.1 hypothetical protein [Thermoplasmata archaeon]